MITNDKKLILNQSKTCICTHVYMYIFLYMLIGEFTESKKKKKPQKNQKQKTLKRVSWLVCVSLTQAIDTKEESWGRWSCVI